MTGFRNGSNRTVRAVFTVEAALLMGILLPVLISILIAAFYVHDAGVLEGLACEAAAMGSNYTERGEGNIHRTASEIGKKRTIWIHDISISVETNKKATVASYSGDFKIPGLMAQLLTGGRVTLTGRCRRAVCQPAKTIRMIRGVMYVLDEFDN